MVRRLLLAGLGMLLVVLLPQATNAQVSSYTFSVGTGTATSESGATALWTGGNPGSGTNNRVASVTLPFTFTFNGVAYTQISISSNGLVGFGATTVTTSSSNNLTNANVPIAAGFWDELTVAGGCFSTKPRVSYITTNTGGGRAFVILYTEMDMYPWRSCFLNSGTFEIRLYEGSNKIEFYYGKMNPCSACDGDCYAASTCQNTSASIGLASSSSDYMSVSPNGAAASTSSTTANNNVNINNSTKMPEGTLYTFVPCKAFGTGRTGPGDGGTANLNNGDVFFSGTWVQTGQQATFRPMSMEMTSGSCPGSVTYLISGPAAADYYFGTPGTVARAANLSNGAKDTLSVTFRPTASGVRNATLTVIATGGYARTFNLAAAAPRINFYGITAQGGSPNMRSGDTLMKNIRVNRLETGTFTPMQLVNIGSAAPVQVTYTLDDPTGQYRIEPPDTLLATGETALPRITFSPVGVGYQPALLYVNTQDEIRVFVLYAYSSAPGGQFFIGGAALDSTSALFNNQATCVGEGVFYYPVTLRNIGDGDFVIDRIYGFQVDSVYRQGTPSYPLLRDEYGRLIPTGEYFFTTQMPGSGPVTPMPLPHIIPEGATETIYLAFIPGRPGKRFVRVYVESNGQNFTYPDTSGTFQLGLLAFNTYGRGNASLLSDNPKGGVPATFVFPKTPIGTSVTRWLVLQNAGTCDLRISENDLRIFAGDVEEIQLVGLSSTWVRDPSRGDLLLGPGVKDSMQVSFRPTNVGSRRASLRLKTNDSTVYQEQLTERGTYYMDLYGEGSDGLYGKDVDFGAVVVGTSSMPLVASFRNAASVPFIINSATIVGADAGDYAEDGVNPWPARPFAIMPGQTVDLSVVFTPSGATGGKSAQLELVSDRDDTVRARLIGEAGSQSVTGPGSVNFGNLTVGKTSRQRITIMNAGTMPAMVGDPVITGANASEFGVSAMARHELAPGQMEDIEISWRPGAQGTSSATLTITADGGDVVIGLSGNGVKTKYVGEDPTGTIGGNEEGGVVPPGTQDPGRGTSGVEGVTRVSGMSLWQSVPNPGRDRVEIRYELSQGGEVELGLYDESGRLVRELDGGDRGVGEHRVMVDLRGLSAGVYHYRLEVHGVTLNRSLVVSR